MRASSRVFWASVFFIIFSFSICQAEISFPFTTTFDCDYVQQNDTITCDGIGWGGHWYFDQYRSQITSDANNPAGHGGKGFRTWDGDGSGVDTGPIAVVFPSPQKELWIRWYQRHQSGYGWKSNSQGTVPLQDKHVYLMTAASGKSAIAEYHYNEYVIIAQGTSNYYQVVTPDDTGWTDVMGGYKSDGEFHCFEIHVKMDTDQTDGVGQVWIDGVLKVSVTNVDWSNGNVDAQSGWTYFKLGENQDSALNGTVMYVDHDDLAVYNSTPPNRDAQGNPFIGPITRVGSAEGVTAPKEFLPEN